jgi:hypothetical protein
VLVIVFAITNVGSTVHCFVAFGRTPAIRVLVPRVALALLAPGVVVDGAPGLRAPVIVPSFSASAPLVPAIPTALATFSAEHPEQAKQTQSAHQEPDHEPISLSRFRSRAGPACREGVVVARSKQTASRSVRALAEPHEEV